MVRLAPNTPAPITSSAVGRRVVRRPRSRDVIDLLIGPPANDGNHFGEPVAQGCELVFRLRRHGRVDLATHEPIALECPQRLSEHLLRHAPDAPLQLRVATPRGTYYLFQMPRWDRRLRIVLDWTVALFSRPDITKVDVALLPEQDLDDSMVAIPLEKSA